MELLSGNEAIAQGAWEAGVHLGLGYPGTPSTETLQVLSKKTDVYAEWCANEKVALEVGIGASVAGARALVTMKHVGVNVAADPLFTSSYTGINGGLVLLAADDPGMYSSQNEQDSHWYALASQIPAIDPADSQEAHDFTKHAFDISEQFDTPVLLRSSMRISHTRTPVKTSERVAVDVKPYEKRASKYIMVPAFAKGRHVDLLKRTEALVSFAEETDLNEELLQDGEIGVICAGATYMHVREALPNASVFKLGMSWPLPPKRLASFAEKVSKLYVFEEGSFYLRNQVAALGIRLDEPLIDVCGCDELSPQTIRKALGLSVPEISAPQTAIPNRPPSLCAGCPHRLVFKELSRLKAIVTGDIGCYTLGSQPPLSAIDTCVDMGASISMAHGFELALAGQEHRPVVGVIGDSTFAHSGITSLLTTIYNKGCGTVCILDNRTTAMTGRQGNPFNGVGLSNPEAYEVDLEELVRALGVRDVKTINPHSRKEVKEALKAAVTSDELTVLICKAPCVLLERKSNTPYYVTPDCKACGQCISIGCPAISKDSETGIASIDTASCIGCGQCSQYCAFNAIETLS